MIMNEIDKLKQRAGIPLNENADVPEILHNARGILYQVYNDIQRGKLTSDDQSYLNNVSSIISRMMEEIKNAS